MGNTPEENSKTKFERTQWRLLHLLQRVDRIKVSKENRTERSKLLAKVLLALDSLETVGKNDPDLSTLFDFEEDLSKVPSNRNKSY